MLEGCVPDIYYRGLIKIITNTVLGVPYYIYIYMYIVQWVLYEVYLISCLLHGVERLVCR